MMAFVLVLMLSITLLVRVETANSGQALNQLRAKESARLALMMALGDLQRYAGPDQRVTARAEILGSGLDGSLNFEAEAQFWTGVWDTTNPTGEAKWLVSGVNPSPRTLAGEFAILEAKFEANAPEAAPLLNQFAPTVAEVVKIADGRASYAYWVSDEGLKAAVSPINTIKHTDDLLDGIDNLYDYNNTSALVLEAVQDPVFDFPLLYSINDSDPDDEALILRAISAKQLELFSQGRALDERMAVSAALKHHLVTHNNFVLTNPIEGGLKKDLSFLKSKDPASFTQSELDSIYSDPDGLLKTPIAEFVQFRGNPRFVSNAETIGMKLTHDTAEGIDEQAVDFTIAPIITEFQLSGGIAADRLTKQIKVVDDEGEEEIRITSMGLDEVTESPVFFVHKIHLELWNPFTTPMRIGDANMPADLGYSDLRISVKNLPSFIIENVTVTGNSFSGSIPDISLKWSEQTGNTFGKTLRPGMVYFQTLPPDSGGENGALHEQIGVGTTINGTARDAYSINFAPPSSPVEISISGISQTGAEKEILKMTIDGYDGFDISYSGESSSINRLKRRLDNGGAGGMGGQSLEVPGYAFAFRFSMLNEKNSIFETDDITKWLSVRDPRTRNISLNLSELDDGFGGWEGDSPIPYDFRVNSDDVDLGDFMHSYGFQQLSLFHFGDTSGRQDRIARFIDLPTSEISDIGSLRSLVFKGYGTNAISNHWGGNLNRLYDRYFFSSLPVPSLAVWDGSSPLGNPRLIKHGFTPQLTDPESANQLFIRNGFNINSTSAIAWQTILSGKDFQPDELNMYYEKAEWPDPPALFSVENPLTNVFFNNPHSSVFNIVEQENAPEYTLITRDETPDYEASFSTDDDLWKTDRQHPAFWHNIRELSDLQIESLTSAIVAEIENFYDTNDRPFFSVSEFLNSSVLENAINNTPTINIRASGVDSIPPYTPAYFSQSTIMNLIGNFVFPRSDTFKIRAYGKATDLRGNNLAEAYCEAIVQRLPDEHSSPEFGRKFKLLGLNWIEPVEQ
jgi:hypothetical protein